MHPARTVLNALLVVGLGSTIAGCGTTDTGGSGRQPLPPRPLRDSAASRDLIAQLPLTIAMVDHASVEKTGALLSPLSLDGQPDGADPDVGDVGYYAPGNDR